MNPHFKESFISRILCCRVTTAWASRETQRIRRLNSLPLCVSVLVCNADFLQSPPEGSFLFPPTHKKSILKFYICGEANKTTGVSLGVMWNQHWLHKLSCTIKTSQASCFALKMSHVIYKKTTTNKQKKQEHLSFCLWSIVLFLFGQISEAVQPGGLNVLLLHHEWETKLEEIWVKEPQQCAAMTGRLLYFCESAMFGVALHCKRSGVQKKGLCHCRDAAREVGSQ